ncbi:sigma-70 family RNA polymerase sigma factor [Cumulibacter soli]|uniref:sigma-70 family RNA polymerase sigma factor n=1 Tax=Cumulibacter soli TaxID=2546344 RepID=UPI001067BD46|nr:sigma-70 family RNA polymerase sigma factor [Cumulibacter soli]
MASTKEGDVNDAAIDRENHRWVEDLTTPGARKEVASRDLFAVLLRVARSEARRRAPVLRLSGPELDDLACQAAADALVAITERLDRFRGDARFTTWACKFVIFNVASKMNRHYWWRHESPYEQEDWSRTPARFDAGPEDEVQAREFAEAVAAAVDQSLSDRQRRVFVANVLNGMPIDALADELGSTHNALYKVLFDARKKLRAALVASGHLTESTIA